MFLVFMHARNKCVLFPKGEPGIPKPDLISWLEDDEEEDPLVSDAEEGERLGPGYSGLE